ncbi:MAG: nuclear transport factor 2 family protein [Flavobacteriaceae bacterium]|nr:nuclear transport factor 2 family protein [Flavobacteriaceae bacterium]
MYTENVREIERLISNYFQGIFNGNTAQLEACFHKDAAIYGDINGSEYLKSLSDYIDGVAHRESPKDLKEDFQMKIIGIDNLGSIAVAKLQVPMLGYNYYDYISLTKINDQWKIVNKVFTHVN